MSYFAEIDKDNIVIRVIVAEQDFIDSGSVGDPSLWIETSLDGSFRKQYAGAGHTYDKINDIFIQPRTDEDSILNSNHDWEPHGGYPDDFIASNGAEQYFWNHDTEAWERYGEGYEKARWAHLEDIPDVPNTDEPDAGGPDRK